jgi:hypothetical protein
VQPSLNIDTIRMGWTVSRTPERVTLPRTRHSLQRPPPGLPQHSDMSRERSFPDTPQSGLTVRFRFRCSSWADADAFHRPGFPALPLSRQGRHLATGIGFDCDDLQLSFEVALTLLAVLRRSESRILE